MDEKRNLTLKELQEMALENIIGFHIWVKMLDLDAVYAAITDVHDHYGIVAVWCAGSEEDWLKEADYGKTWLAYLEKPASKEVPEPPPRW